MRTLTIGLGVAVVVVIGAQGLMGQSDDKPFHVRGERGELVHVLPPPALVHNPSDRNQVFAPASDTPQVFSASFGSGNLIDHGGNEISGAQVQAIFWNSDLARDGSTSLGYPSLESQIDAFLARYGTGSSSPYPADATSDYAIIQQYGSSLPINPGFGIFAQDFVDSTNGPSGGTPSNPFTDTMIQSYLAGLFTRGVTASSSVIYAIYFPKGATIQLSSSKSCTSFCGYHNHFQYGTLQIKYAVFPYLDCTGCTIAGDSLADMLTLVSSHEIRESATDPGDDNVNAWYDRRGYEADDKCAWHNLYQMAPGGVNGVGGFLVQPEYSNGGTVTRSGFTATYPGPGCVVPFSTGQPPPRKHHK